MITSKIIANGIVKAVGLLGLVVIIIYFLNLIQSVLIYLIVAFILTLIGNPILLFFRKRLKLSNTFATIMTLFIFVLIIIGFILMFIPLVTSQSQSLSLLNTATIEKNTFQLINQISVFLENHNINPTLLMKEANLASKINFKFIPNFLNLLLATISSIGIGLASVLFITFFFLKDQNLIIKNLQKIIPDEHEEKILNSIEKINHLLSRYFIGLLLQLLVVFILYLIVLLLFGIQNALIIAFLCSILNIIPYIGPLIATILAALLTMISNIGGDFQTEILPTTMYILIGFWLVQLIDNNLSQPIIFSKSVSSHPLEIFLTILIAGFLFGIIGMIFVVPLYTILKVIGKEFFPENRLIQIFTKSI